jgi:hypothetical protein
MLGKPMRDEKIEAQKAIDEKQRWITGIGVMFDSHAIPKIAWYEIVVAGNRALNEVMLPGDLPIQECSTSQSEQYRLPESALKFGD